MFITKEKGKLIVLGVFVVFSTFFISKTEAIILGSDLSLSITPNIPGPNKEVVMKVEYSGIDLNRSEISWFKNEILQKKGVGERQFSFISGGLGTSDFIEVQIMAPSGKVLTQNVTIAPADVDLLWQTDSSKPPFYKGKPLNSHRSVVTFVAMPNFIDTNGNKLDPKDLFYEWKRNFEAIGNSTNGFGKNSLVIDQAKFFRKNVITVRVSDKDGIFKAEKNVSLTNHDPKILFYEKDPLLGTIYENAVVGDFTLKNEEITLVAEPFSFSGDDVYNNNIIYSWFLNGKKIQNLTENLKEITLKQGSDVEKGVSSIRATFRNNKRVLQGASADVKVLFDKENKTF